MSFNGPFADFIRQLPQPELPLEGAKAFLLSSPQGQAAFFEVPAGAEFPMHSHGAQWGIIVEGEAEFTLDGVVRICKKGDTYNIGAGVEHGIKVLKDLLAIDIFQDPNRYQAKD